MEPPHEPGSAATDEGTPSISVVLCTYQRGHLIDQAVDGVLAQEGAPSFELVVVVDGSTDDTLDRLAARSSDPRLRVVSQPNAGLGAARRAGAAAARAPWLVFIDDDDVPHPDWLAVLGGPMADAGTALVRCGCRRVTPDGEVVGAWDPTSVPSVPGLFHGKLLPGTFAVRRDLYDASGGFLAGLGFSLQYELGHRLAAVAAEQGLAEVRLAAAPYDYLQLPAEARSFYAPRLLADDGRWCLVRHPRLFREQHRAEAANLCAVVGVNAARLDDGATARRWFGHAVRLAPTQPRRWLQYLAALVPPLGRRIWGRSSDFSASGGRRGLLMHGRPTSPDADPADALFLPWRYQRNLGADATVVDAAATGIGTLDLGDSLERSAAPRAALTRAREQLAPGGTVAVLASARPHADELGPPADASRVQVWSPDELTLLLEAEGFEVRSRRRRHGGVELRALRQP